MKQIAAIARFKIKENKLSEFKKIAGEMIQAVRDNEPGALVYDWYLDELKMECIVLETYEDSKAVMAHVGNVGEKLQDLSEYGDLSLEVLGEPDEELTHLIMNMGSPPVYTYFSGL